VLVTIFFNLLMLPTRIMMMKSSLKMQRVQPKMDAIKKKYAHLKPTDPKRAEMNAETMQLYKEEGINMYGRCLPILVQMPLFFAYYRVLANVSSCGRLTGDGCRTWPLPTRCTFCPLSSSAACSWCSSSPRLRGWTRRSAR
jgi:YidC/Oxa1 family membrane protein insertase